MLFDTLDIVPLTWLINVEYFCNTLSYHIPNIPAGHQFVPLTFLGELYEEVFWRLWKDPERKKCTFIYVYQFSFQYHLLGIIFSICGICICCGTCIMYGTYYLRNLYKFWYLYVSCICIIHCACIIICGIYTTLYYILK